MKIQQLPFQEIPQFSERDIAYVNAHPKLRPFYKYDVALEAFGQTIKDKAQQPINRTVLVEVLQEQYQAFSTHELVQRQIQSLAQSRTFTVITAHQPSLFTGPLYFIYKIFSAINLAEQLNQHYPEHHIVPIFVLGSEDHDFEEINHLHLFGKKIVWQNEESGAVGQMQTNSLKTVLEELKSVLGNSEKAEDVFQLIQRCFTTHSTYGTATQVFVHELFKDYGLVVFNMNHPKLKRAFIPYIKEEILHQPSKAIIEQTQIALSEAGFTAQAMPRDINFFYLSAQSRERIVQEGAIFKVLNTPITFTAQAMEQAIEMHPERFSPNVVMRPIYQEVILPNLAYIGGGGELAYWQERLAQFEHFKVNYPMLVRRNSVLWVDKSTQQRLEKLNLSIEQLLGDIEVLIKQYVQENSERDLNLTTEKTQVEKIFEGILQKAIEVDPTLEKATSAELAKVLNAMSGLEAKLMRAEKNRYDVTINQIRNSKEKLFPSNGLQERYDNFLGIYLKHGITFFDTLKTHLNPLQKMFTVISEV